MPKDGCEGCEFWDRCHENTHDDEHANSQRQHPDDQLAYLEEQHRREHDPIDEPEYCNAHGEIATPELCAKCGYTDCPGNPGYDASITYVMVLRDTEQDQGVGAGGQCGGQLRHPSEMTEDPDVNPNAIFWGMRGVQ